MKYIFLLLCFVPFFSVQSSEIIGLDSMDLGNRIVIQDLKPSIYTGEIDTFLIYLYVISREGQDKPDLLLKQSQYPEKIMLIEEDSTYSYFTKEQNYIKFKTNTYDYENELSVFSSLIDARQNPHTTIRKFTRNIKVESVTEIKPEENKILHSSKLYSPNGVLSSYEVTLDTKNYNRVEYKFYYIDNGDTVQQLSAHYVYSSSADKEIFDELEDFYKNGRSQYATKEVTAIAKEKPKNIAVGDTIDINYTLIGLNKEDLNIGDFLQSNDYLIVYTWGTWCGPCIMNAKNIEEFNKKYKKPGFATLMYEKGSADDKEMRIYAERNSISYPVYFNDEFIKRNNFNSFPTFAVIGKGGIVKEVITGYTKELSRYDNIISEYGK